MCRRAPAIWADAFCDSGAFRDAGGWACCRIAGLMRVVVRLQFLRLVRMTMRPVFPLMLVRVLLSIACVGMLVPMLMLMFVFVDVVVLVSVRRLVVGVLMCMCVSVFVLMLVAMIVLTFHRISSLFSVWRRASLDSPILAESETISAPFNVSALPISRTGNRIPACVKILNLTDYWTA